MQAVKAFRRFKDVGHLPASAQGAAPLFLRCLLTVSWDSVAEVV